MHIQLSSATYEHLKGSHFIFERRGTITIKVRRVKTVSTATLLLHSRSHSNKHVIIMFCCGTYGHQTVVMLLRTPPLESKYISFSHHTKPA